MSFDFSSCYMSIDTKEFDSLDLVKQIIKNSVEKSENNVVCIHSLETKKYATRCLIDNAKGHVSIFTGSLEDMYLEEPLELKAYKNALDSGVKIGVVVEDKEIGKVHKSLSKLKCYYLYKSKLKGANLNNHFLLTGKHVLIEEPHEHKNLEPNARIFLNDTVGSSNIYDIFKEILKHSEPLETITQS